MFVGTLVKNYEGRRGVSGNAACRWYINNDISEMIDLNTRLQDKFSPIQKIPLQGQSVAEVSAHVDLETKTVAEQCQGIAFALQRLTTPKKPSLSSLIEQGRKLLVHL